MLKTTTTDLATSVEVGGKDLKSKETQVENRREKELAQKSHKGHIEVQKTAKSMKGQKRLSSEVDTSQKSRSL